MRYPEFLKPGGRIGFIAPSFGCTGDYYGVLFEEALKIFAQEGFTVVPGPNCRLAEGIGKSNTAEKCAEEINEFFLSDRADVIISAGGGETMCEDLSSVDFDSIAQAKPRWFMGYSDNTNLTFTLPVLCDTAAIYGPCVAAFAKKPRHAYVKDAMSMLTGKKLTVQNYDGWEKTANPEEENNPFLPLNITEPFEPKIFKAGGEEAQKVSMNGRLLGGCLDILSVLCGTRFDKVKEFNERYKEDGTLWFLESCDLNPMSIRRSLWQLREAGWFGTAKGFLIGRALHFDEELMGMDRINAVTGALSDLQVPFILDADLGHLPPSMPLISGSCAHVQAEKGSLRVDMRLT